MTFKLEVNMRVKIRNEYSPGFPGFYTFSFSNGDCDFSGRVQVFSWSFWSQLIFLFPVNGSCRVPSPPTPLTPVSSLFGRRPLWRPRCCTRRPSSTSMTPGNGGSATWWWGPTTAWSVTRAWRWVRPQSRLRRSNHTRGQEVTEEPGFYLL